MCETRAAVKAPTMFENAKQDWRAAHHHAGSRPRALLSKGLWFVFAQRLIRWLEHVPVAGKPMRHLLFPVITVLWRSDIAMDAHLGPGLLIPRPLGVVIGPKAKLGRDVTIASRVTIGQKSYTDKSIAVMGDAVVIGKGVAIIGAVTIGDGARIAPYSVVIDSVAPKAEVSGNPAN